MHPYQILVLSSGVWWSLLRDIRCLWRHNMTLFSRSQTNVLAKFVDTTCIFRDARVAVEKQSRRHGGFWGISTPKQSAKTHQIELWSTVNRWSFYQVSECQATLNRRKAPLSKTFCRRFYREGGARINLTVMETYKKDRYQLCCSCSSTTLTSKIITGMIENHSEFAACRNSCNEFVSSPSS